MFELCAVQVRKYLLIDYGTEGTPKGILAVRNQEAVLASFSMALVHFGPFGSSMQTSPIPICCNLGSNDNWHHYPCML